MMCGSFLPSLWLVGATKAYRGIGAVIVYGIISLATGSMGVIDFVNFVINPEVRLRLLLWRGLLHRAIRITPLLKIPASIASAAIDASCLRRQGPRHIPGEQ